MNHVTVIGAGLAGSECAWQLAQRGIGRHDQLEGAVGLHRRIAQDLLRLEVGLADGEGELVGVRAGGHGQSPNVVWTMP